MTFSKPTDERVYFVTEQNIRESVSHRFELVKRKLEALVPDADIQHVGSTAVPGSLTKGDIDIQVRVNALQYAQVKELLSSIYSINGGGFVADDGTSFEDYNNEPSVGVHLTVIGGTCDVQYKFRDLLIKSASLRKAYDDFKRQFEAQSMEEYRNAKAEFVEHTLNTESSMEA